MNDFCMLPGQFMHLDKVDVAPLTCISINVAYTAACHRDEDNKGPSVLRAHGRSQGLCQGSD